MRARAATSGARSGSSRPDLTSSASDGRRVLDEDAVAECLAEAADLPYLKIATRSRWTARSSRRRSRPFARRHAVVPVAQRGETVVFALTDPFDAALRESLQQLVRRPLEFVVAAKRDILTLSTASTASAAACLAPPSTSARVARAPRSRPSCSCAATRTDIAALPVIKGDEVLLRQAITNLVLNAVEAMPEGGELPVTGTLSERNVLISVSDSGHGIDMNIRDKIFLPFYTTKERGTGLGLAIVHKIVIAHGGTVNIESSDQGTTFTICLPAAQPLSCRTVITI